MWHLRERLKPTELEPPGCAEARLTHVRVNGGGLRVVRSLDRCARKEKIIRTSECL